MNEVDRKIIAKLQEDGRMSLKDIAEAFGYISMGIKKHVALAWFPSWDLCISGTL